MANVIKTNTINVDSTGEIFAANVTNIKVNSIIYTPDLANDSMVITDITSGAVYLTLKGAVAKDTLHFIFEIPIVFPAGLFINSLSANGTATIVYARGGR